MAAAAPLPPPAPPAPPPLPASILQEYAESAADLPLKLHSAFATIRQLDEEDAALGASLEAALLRLAGGASSDAGPAARKGRGEAAQAALTSAAAEAATAVEHASTKVTLANECYDLVDSHIRRLDKDLAFLDQEAAKLTGDGVAAAPATAPLPVLGAACYAPLLTGTRRSDARAGSRAKRAGGGCVRGLGSEPAHGQPASAAGAAEVVDPNEPKYCSCQRVSFGDMIACENDACPIEWFHYDCVGLLEEPTGKWYCPMCAMFKSASASGAKRARPGGEGGPGTA